MQTFLPYCLHGLVVAGRHQGRLLGYPTANIQVDTPDGSQNYLGVFAATVDLLDQSYRAMVNIGTCPTFELGSRLQVEVHLFDFSGDLYGQTLKVKLVAFVRKEQKFPTIEALQAQLHCDAQTVKQFFATKPA